jgi:hypothetical protein
VKNILFFLQRNYSNSNSLTTLRKKNIFNQKSK